MLLPVANAIYLVKKIGGREAVDTLMWEGARLLVC